MKFDSREIVALLIVLLLPLGLGQLAAKATLPEYGAASGIMQSALGAGAAPAHIAAASALEGVYASLMGLPAASAQAIVGFLLAFPPVLLALSSVLLYLACRQMGYKKTESVFASALFSLSSTVALSFLPGVYGSAQLATFLFAAFLLPMAAFVQKPGRMAMLGAAIVLGFAAGYVNAAFAIAGIAMAVAFAFAHHKKNGEKNYLPLLGVLALLFAAAGVLSPDKSALAFSADNLSSAALFMPFLLSGAAICLGLYFFGRKDAEYFALLLLGVALCGFSPLAGALLLVFPVAEGATKAGGDISKGAKLAAAFACGFFMVFGLVYGGAGIYPAIGAGVMIGLLAPLLLHFYDYNARALFSALGAALLLFSLFFAVFVQLPPLKQGFPSYTDPALSQALSYMSGKGASGIATLERQDAVSFYLPGAAVENGSAVDDFLLAKSGKLQKGSYLLFSLPMLENVSQQGGFDVYYYAQNYTNSGTTFALFISQQGRLISRELDAGGNFALKDGAALDSNGAYYAAVPLPLMVMLSDSKPISDRYNRMLVLGEGAAPPRIVGIYSGKDSGVALEKEFAGVDVYRVN